MAVDDKTPEADAVPIAETSLQRMIRQRKDELGLSYDQIAIRAGRSITRSRVQQIVTRPMRELPDLATLEALAKGLHVPRAVIMREAALSFFGEDVLSALDDADFRVLAGRAAELPEQRRDVFLRMADSLLGMLADEQGAVSDLDRHRSRRTRPAAGELVEPPKQAAARVRPANRPTPGEQELTDP